MTRLRGLSDLPDDQGYWHDLEARIMAELAPRIREGSHEAAGWWTPIASHAWALGIAAAAATLATLLLVPARSSTGAPRPMGLLRLPEGDPGLVTFLSSPAPPALASIVWPGTPERSP